MTDKQKAKIERVVRKLVKRLQTRYIHDLDISDLEADVADYAAAVAADIAKIA